MLHIQLRLQGHQHSEDPFQGPVSELIQLPAICRAVSRLLLDLGGIVQRMTLTEKALHRYKTLLEHYLLLWREQTRPIISKTRKHRTPLLIVLIDYPEPNVLLQVIPSPQPRNYAEPVEFE